MKSSISPAAFLERDAFPAIFALNGDLLIAFAVNAHPERQTGISVPII